MSSISNTHARILHILARPTTPNPAATRDIQQRLGTNPTPLKAPDIQAALHTLTQLGHTQRHTSTAGNGRTITRWTITDTGRTLTPRIPNPPLSATDQQLLLRRIHDTRLLAAELLTRDPSLPDLSTFQLQEALRLRGKLDPWATQPPVTKPKIP